MGVMKRLSSDRAAGLQLGADVKRAFFDRMAVVNATDSATRNVLSKFGAYVRRTAKSSIRKRKAASAPGEPPSSHVGTLKNLIYFSYEATDQNVVIGPTPIGHGWASVPELLEYGGGVIRRKNTLRRTRRIGDGGEIKIGGRSCATTKTNRFGARVTYARITTQAQADRANELQELLYGPMWLSSTKLEARPYMHPAMDQNLPKLPAMWTDSVKP